MKKKKIQYSQRPVETKIYLQRHKQRLKQLKRLVCPYLSIADVVPKHNSSSKQNKKKLAP